jgi:hypothetical protein
MYGATTEVTVDKNVVCTPAQSNCPNAQIACADFGGECVGNWADCTAYR